mmetsp:Transcript_28865/g.40573  ORF Transcript_28865/g.40573 Transcript_28865/m.40573 type:complete len:169 (+) Transcript_28865:128-634(+)
MMTMIWRQVVSQTKRSGMPRAIILTQSTAATTMPRNYNTLALATLDSESLAGCSTKMRSPNNNTVDVHRRFLSNPSTGEGVIVSQTTNTATEKSLTKENDDTKIRINACGDDDDDEYDSEEEQEEMFVDPHESLGHSQREWGGPRRGGRFAEPTRFGDWERKGRCTDF